MTECVTYKKRSFAIASHESSLVFHPSEQIAVDFFFNLLVVVTREWHHSVSEDVILPLAGTVFKRSETIHSMQTLNLGSCFNTKTIFPDMGSSMMKIRRSWECLVVITGILFAQDQMWFPISTVYMHQFKKHRIELDSVCANTISAARSILTWKQFWQYIFSGSLKKMLYNLAQCDKAIITFLHIIFKQLLMNMISDLTNNCR